MKSLLSLAVGIFLFLPSVVDGAAPASTLLFENEEIVYAIKKLGVKAGSATISFKGAAELNKRRVYLIVFRATALNFSDEEKIYADPVTFLPVLVERELNLWGSRERIVETYDAANGTVRITKTAAGKTTEQVIKKKEALDNIYCFIYRQRRDGQFKAGDAFKISLPTQNVRIRLSEKTRISLAGKSYNAFFMESDPAKYRVWFDEGAKKMPLRIDGAVGFGNTSMVLVNYEKAKGPD